MVENAQDKPKSKFSFFHFALILVIVTSLFIIKFQYFPISRNLSSENKENVSGLKKKEKTVEIEDFLGRDKLKVKIFSGETCEGNTLPIRNIGLCQKAFDVLVKAEKIKLTKNEKVSFRRQSKSYNRGCFILIGGEVEKVICRVVQGDNIKDYDLTLEEKNAKQEKHQEIVDNKRKRKRTVESFSNINR